MAQANKKFSKASQIAQEQGYEVPEEAKKQDAPETLKGEIKKPEEKEKPTESQGSYEDYLREPKEKPPKGLVMDSCPDHTCPIFKSGGYDPKSVQCSSCYEDFRARHIAERHKPEYGDFVAFTFERTVSIRQFEPFRVQATYRVGKDDLLSDIIRKSRDFNAAIEEAFHTPPPAADQVATARPQEAQAQTQHPMGGPPPAPPTISYPDNADKVSGASEKQIRKCYAVWHQMGEPANLKPSGKWSRKEASDYIDKYDRQGQNQGGDKPFPTPEERGYRTRFY